MRKYISYYKPPNRDYKEFLFKNIEDDWEYTRDIKKAFLFDSKETALSVTPSYDGSGNIEERAGIIGYYFK